MGFFVSETIEKKFVGTFLFIESGVEGFEPPNGGTKTRSLTTWPYPNIKNFFLKTIMTEFFFFCQEKLQYLFFFKAQPKLILMSIYIY